MPTESIPLPSVGELWNFDGYLYRVVQIVTGVKYDTLAKRYMIAVVQWDTRGIVESNEHSWNFWSWESHVRSGRLTQL